MKDLTQQLCPAEDQWNPRLSQDNAATCFFGDSNSVNPDKKIPEMEPTDIFYAGYTGRVRLHLKDGSSACRDKAKQSLIDFLSDNLWLDFPITLHPNASCSEFKGSMVKEPEIVKTTVCFEGLVQVESGHCLIKHSIFGSYIWGEGPNRLNIITGNSQLNYKYWKLTSSLRGPVYIFGVGNQYVTFAGKGGTFEFRPSNTKPNEINIAEHEDQNDPRAFYSNSRNGEMRFELACRRKVYAQLDKKKMTVIAGEGDNWVLQLGSH